MKDARCNAGPFLSQKQSFHWLIRGVNVATRALGLVKMVLAVYVGQHPRRGRELRLLMVNRAIITMYAAVVLLACDSRPAPQREWRPEDHGQPAEIDPARVPQTPAPNEEGGVERAAAALWNVSCASCHGRDGRGQGPGRPPAAQIPDFTSGEFQKQRTDAELAAVIQNGRGMMPGFGKQLNEQGLSALVKQVRSFAAAK
jgi:cytochrome c oxidase cbb3-type subunit 3